MKTNNFLQKMIRNGLMLGMAYLLLLAGSSASAGSDEEIVAEKLFQMSFGELLNVEVTTAGKKAEKIADIPASVVVISREEIERIEVIRGLMSVVYGSGTFFSVINIITNEIPSAKRNLVAGKAGTYDTYSGILAKWLTTSASLFYHRLDNLLLRNTGFNSQGNYHSAFLNYGKMSTIGSELSLRAEVGNRLDG